MTSGGWGAWLAGARRSSAGTLVRRAVPQSVRRRMARTVVGVLPAGSALARETRRGLHATVTDARAPAAASTAIPASADATAPRPPLVLIVGLHRSGTTALDAMLADAFPALQVEGELFYGVLTDGARAALQPRFPWIDRVGEAAGRGLAGAAFAEHEADFRAAIAEEAPSVVRTLLAGRSGTTTIKVLDGQLPLESLTRVLEEFRPHVITLRRVLLLSIASWARARQSGRWRDADSTSVALPPFDEAEVRRYVESADAWFTSVAGRVSELGLASTDLTYSGVFDTGAELPLLRSTFAHLEWRPLTTDRDGGWTSPLGRQDRRTDDSVLALLAALRDLPIDVRDDLMRLPGA